MILLTDSEGPEQTAQLHRLIWAFAGNGPILLYKDRTTSTINLTAKFVCRKPILLKTRAQLFKTNNVVSKRIIKTLIMKYVIYVNIFAEKCE